MRYLLLLGCLLFVLPGCKSATHMVYVHRANLGLEVTPVAESGAARMTLGYDRDTFALVPRKGDNASGADAMSLVAVSRVRANSLSDVQFAHTIASGNAAKAVVKDPTKLKGIAASMYVKQKAVSQANQATKAKGQQQ